MGDDNADQDRLAWCISSMEGILKYNFRNKKLLEDALTHPSFPERTSFNDLVFLGDSVLSSAVSNFIFITYPTLNPGQLSTLRDCHINTEKLARVAVRHGIYRFIRHGQLGLIRQVQKFVLAVMEEDEILPCGGVVKAPKILSCIVQSIAAAVYVDCGFDLKVLWLVFRDLLEPIVTWETLQEHDRPVKVLQELCSAQGKHLKMESWKASSKNFTSIYVGGKLVASASSNKTQISSIIAAREALRTLAQGNVSGGGTCGFTSEVDERSEVGAAKLKLSNICVKQKWPEPSYRVEKDERSGAKKYVCSVRVEAEGEVLVMRGFEESTMEDAKNSAASFMICSLLAQGHVQWPPLKRWKSSINFEDNNDKDVGDEIKIKDQETSIRRRKRRPASGDRKEDQPIWVRL